MSKFYKYLKESYKYSKNLQRVDAGGGYGHLSQIWDIDFSFGNLKEIIKDSLSGNLEYVREKTDGQNLLFTWKDNQLLFARNKGHIKNYGSNALTIKELAKKFSGRGALEEAYNAAATDLSNAIKNLSQKQREKIFKNGKKFMSCEVIYPENPNIIPYGAAELRMHGTKEYDKNGNEIDDNKEDGRILAGMIKQIKQDKQSTYEIKDLKKIDLPKTEDFEEQSKRLIKKLESIMKKYNLSDNDTLVDYRKAYFRNLLEKKNVEYNDKLLNRWANFDKSYSIKQIRSDFSEDNFEKIKEIDDNMKKHIKDCMLPIEKILLELGTIVLKNISDVMALNPEKAKQDMRKRLVKAIKEIKAKGGPKMIDKLKMELDRLQAAGGFDAILPTEGITFIWKGKFMKITGGFAISNQLINLLWQLE